MSPLLKTTQDLVHEIFASQAEHVRRLQSLFSAAQAHAGQLLEEMEADRTRLIDLLQTADIPVMADSIEPTLPVEALAGQTAALALEQEPVEIEPPATAAEEFCLLEENDAASASVCSPLGLTYCTDVEVLTTEQPAKFDTHSNEEGRICEEFGASRLTGGGEIDPAAPANGGQQEDSAVVAAPIVEITANVSVDEAGTDTYRECEPADTKNATCIELASTTVAETPTDLVPQIMATALTPAIAAEVKFGTAQATDVLQPMPVVASEDIVDAKHNPVDAGISFAQQQALPRIDNVIALSACRSPRRTHVQKYAVAAVAAFLLIISGSAVMYPPLHAGIGSHLWKSFGCSAPGFAGYSACSMVPQP